MSEESTQQSVTIFSNGIADFRRVINVSASKPTAISIPVKEEYIGDILDSLHVTGAVSYDKPATYQQANDQVGALNIDPTRVIETLSTKLSGATIKVETNSNKYTGQLLGLDTAVQLDANNKSTTVRSILVLTSDGIVSAPLKDVINFEFTDEDVKEEIAKALKRNFQSIKPNSTFVDLTLRADADTKAVLRYSIPSAAWTMTYSLRELDEGYEFQGSAVVPNKTDEDWKDVTISIVSGEPVTFATDIAQSKIPSRQFVPIIKDSAQGAVEVEEGFYNNSQINLTDTSGNVEAYSRGASKSMSFARNAPMAASAVAGGARPAAMMGFSPESVQDSPSATFQEAAVRDVGDFSVFTAQNVLTIPAKRSALIPVFTKTITGAKTVLYYKESNNSERPLRAIEFTNETDHSLNRGPCIIDRDGTFQGKSILPATKPGEKCLLTHAVETGLRIRANEGDVKTKVVLLQLADGVFYTTTKQTRQTTYRIHNSKKEEFRLLLDHDRDFNDSEFKLTHKKDINSDEFHTVEPQQSLSKGFRVALDLLPKAQARFVAVETQVKKSKVTLQTGNWFQQVRDYISDDGVFEDEFKPALEVWDQLKDKQAEIQKVQSEHTSKSQKQVRLRENLKSLGGNGDEQRNSWVKELADVENALTKIEEVTLPQLQKENQDLNDKLQSILKSTQAEWAEPVS